MKPVAYGSFRQQISGLVWIRLQLAPELLNHDPHVFNFSAAVPVPDGSGQVSMRSRLIGVRHQVLQDQILFRGKMTGPAFWTLYPVGVPIDGTILENNFLFHQGVRRGVVWRHSSRQFSSDARHGKIFVGASIQRVYCGTSRAPQDNDAEFGLRPDEATQPVCIDAVDDGIHDEQVVWLKRCPLNRLYQLFPFPRFCETQNQVRP